VGGAEIGVPTKTGAVETQPAFSQKFAEKIQQKNLSALVQ
jgi:hypothetical protein